VLVDGRLREGHRRHQVGRWRECLIFVAFVGPNLVCLGVFVFWPLLYNAYLSLTDWDMISPVKLFVGLQNYADAVADPLFRKVLLNTFVLMGGAVAATLGLGLAFALVLDQKLALRNAARSVLFSPTMLSGAAIAVVWVYIFDPTYGLIQALVAPLGIFSPNWLRDPRWAMLAVIVVYVWKNLGYALVVFLAGLQAIPRHLYEAALVDGAGPWARFRAVTLPGLSPITFFLLVTSVLASFQTFDIIQVLTQGGPVNATNTLVYHLYEEGFVGFHAGRAGVVAVTLFLLMLAVTAAQQRYLERQVYYG
jgi:multiple sugar transport system permease protein/sn-glycerol 3-phosphate transport system permease protein